MGHAEKRLARIDYILSLLKAADENGQVWGEERLISEINTTFGSARRYVREILQDLSNTKRIVRDVGEVFLPGQYKKIRAQGSSAEPVEQHAKELLKNLSPIHKNQKEVKKSGN